MNRPVYTGSDGHLTDEALARCLDAQAGGPLDSIIADHLDQCETCKEAIHDLALALRDTAYDRHLESGGRTR